jgi:hypothetical protein
MKKLALTCVILMALVCVWGLMSSGVSITINGNAIHSPFQSIASIWELVITGVPTQRGQELIIDMISRKKVQE